MRITGGQSKGRLLASLKGLSIRPSSDKVREAVFNLLGQEITGLKVLDLFAGTGSFGLEALSRGALWAMFIDNSRHSINLIKKNLKLCNYESAGFVLKWDLIRGLPWKNPLMGKKIDLVFIDPPYGKDLMVPVLSNLSDRGTLAPHSTVVAESSKNNTVPDRLGKLRLFDTRIYGDTRIDIFNYEDTK